MKFDSFSQEDSQSSRAYMDALAMMLSSMQEIGASQIFVMVRFRDENGFTEMHDVCVAKPGELKEKTQLVMAVSLAASRWLLSHTPPPSSWWRRIAWRIAMKKLSAM